MNRRKFVLSWGRKIFFGMSWPLTSLIGLIYLKSYIIPQNAADILYYVTTSIGHYGLMNALVYFLLYAPVVLLIPTYYVSRFWSLFLILALNLLVLVDGVIFSSYLVHSYSFISKLLLQGGLQYLQGANTLGILVPCGVLFISVVLWIRGELIWRAMQRRFSNPVKNWYLGLIVLCLLVSQLVYQYAGIHPKMTSVFPVNYKIGNGSVPSVDRHSFYYPASTIECSQKANKNLIVITVKNLSAEQVSEEVMPKLFAMKKHAEVFNSHYAVSSNPELGDFTLKYSIPGNYLSSSSKHGPALLTELSKRQYEIVRFDSAEAFNAWMIERPEDEILPFYASVTLSQGPSEVDTILQNAVNLLYKEGLLEDTHVVLTSSFAGSETKTVPLFIFTTDRKHKDYSHVTSHYDVIPTVMDKVWGCKNTYKYASTGKSLYEAGQDWLFVSQGSDFKVVDLKNSVLTNFENGFLTDSSLVGGAFEPRRELVFEALKLRAKFSKPR